MAVTAKAVEEARITTVVDLIQQCEELGMVEHVSDLERHLAEVIGGGTDEALNDRYVELVKKLVTLVGERGGGGWSQAERALGLANGGSGRRGGRGGARLSARSAAN